MKITPNDLDEEWDSKKLEVRKENQKKDILFVLKNKSLRTIEVWWVGGWGIKKCGESDPKKKYHHKYNQLY